jgi:hypothetical protein
MASIRLGTYNAQHVVKETEVERMLQYEPIISHMEPKI